MKVAQDVIHQIEVAGRGGFLRYLLAFLAACLLVVVWNFRCYRNMATQEAMDAAQLGRNLADGQGYTTSFIRPFSMYLLARKEEARSGVPGTGKLAEYSRIKDAHPDITNPPVYPLVLAGLMNVLRFDYAIPKDYQRQKAFWSSNGRFWRYQPDFLIAVFNEALFLIVIVLTFFWARKLFDTVVAWLSCALLFGSELLWRFSVSGLSTMLLLLIFMGVVWCLTLLEGEFTQPRRGPLVVYALTIAVGVLVGLGGLTRYAFAWLIVPVLVFLALFAGPRRLLVCLVALVAFAAVLTPWIARNCRMSGAPFGTASYTLLEGSNLFPEHRLERSVNPDLKFVLDPLRVKLFVNAREIMQTGLFNLGGGWITTFFLAGLMITFRSPAVRRMRYFALASLGTLIFVQALGRTQLSDDSPTINSENLLVLLAPLAVVYAASLFMLLLDQFSQRSLAFRHAATAAFVLLASLPLVFALLPPRTIPVVYPPYDPRAIQETTEVMKENALLMSDVPWAVAWYGRQRCLWLTLNATPDPNDPGSKENFSAISDYQKHINGLYLTPRTMDGRFVTDWYSGGEHGWGVLLMNTILRKAPPPNFPLQQMRNGYLPDQLFLADEKLW